MSDVNDVMDSLVTAVAYAVYPDADFDIPGIGFDKGGNFDQPLTGSIAETTWNSGVKWNSGRKWNARKIPSVSGTPVIIYPGWPSSAGLNADLAVGKTHITVFPKAEERNTTRYGEREQITAAPAPTLTLTISGPLDLAGAPRYDIPNVDWDTASDYDRPVNQVLRITVGGMVSVPQNLALRINGQFYTYAVQGDDTLDTIATALAALVNAAIAGSTATGAVITVGPTGRLQAARVGGFGSIGKEVRRQERVVMVSVWANSPLLRKTIGSAIDVALAQIRFLALPDGSVRA